MKHITLTDEQYEQLLGELNSLAGYHSNDDTVHSECCGSKVLSTIEVNVSESLLTEQQSEAIKSMFEMWFADDMPLPGDVSYADAIEALRKIGLDRQAGSIEMYCRAVDSGILEDPGWEKLSDYHGDDRHCP